MKTSKNNPRLNIWANILLSIGLLAFLALSYLLYQRYNPQNLSFNVSASESYFQEVSQIAPIGIKINSINLSLGITPAQINNNRWEASTTGISHLKSSVVPGQKGNAVLYGHNWPNLLGNLKDVKVGDTINVTNSDQSEKTFVIEYITEVTPLEISILEESEDTRITLYTCSGFLDTKRLVVVAKLIQ